MSRLKQLERFGQSVWLDFIRRSLLTSGGLKRLVEEDGVKGVTSNPAIFEKAIGGGDEYRAPLAAVARVGDDDAERLYEKLAIEDIRTAAEQMAAVFEASGGRDGFVSLEVSPRLAHDTERTVTEAHRLWSAVSRPNLMIKVPATPEGLPAIERLIADGINVNVTLLFSVEVYAQVAEAYIRGLEHRLTAGKPIKTVASVASFFVSRIDTEVDGQLDMMAAAASTALERDHLLTLRGKAAIANAKMAYQRFKRISGDGRWKSLASHGAHVQRLLWGSTGTKNPAYPDTIYVDQLIGRDTVNTMPPATLDAFRDRGNPAATLEEDIEGAQAALNLLADAGIVLDAVTAKLLADGVKLFDDAYTRLLEAVGRARTAA
ncbi:MAG TPA: transaldolase [Burkholderiales bacterium]|nr:transaldolase [Burkholderiales bacterium]